jgi:hypothetical protein
MQFSTLAICGAFQDDGDVGAWTWTVDVRCVGTSEEITRSRELVFSNDCAVLRSRSAAHRSENKVSAAWRVEIGRMVESARSTAGV